MKEDAERDPGWFWCEITETPDPPDFSKVPPHVRGKVQADWQKRNTKTQRYRIYGPQIPLFKTWYPSLEVVGPCEPPQQT